MTIGENIKRIRTSHDMSQEEFGRIANVSAAAVSAWEKDQKTPRMGPIEKIAAHFHLKKSDIIEDQERIVTTKDTLIDLMAESYRVPVIGSVRCGPGGYAYEYIDDEYIAIDASLSPSKTRGFRIEGDSMEGDHIFEGDIAVVKLQPEVENGQLAVVVIDNDEGTLKRVYMQYDPMGALVRLTLAASNPKYPPRIFSKEDINRVNIIGKVVEIRRSV